MQRTDVREQDESKAMRYSPFRMQQSANVCSLQGLPAAMLKSYAVYDEHQLQEQAKKQAQWFFHCHCHRMFIMQAHTVV